jgi:hypothetical protein
MPMTRDEHLKWCKKRALEYLEAGDVHSAIASMMSDLKKHEELGGISDILTQLGLSYAMNQDHDGARRFIEGFR